MTFPSRAISQRHLFRLTPGPHLYFLRRLHWLMSDPRARKSRSQSYPLSISLKDPPRQQALPQVRSVVSGYP